MNGHRERLWLALRLKDLPLSAQNAAIEPGEAVAVVDKRRVVAASDSAGSAGVVPGMDTATARLLSGCRTLPRNTAAENSTLEKLQNRLYRFSPHIEIHRSRHGSQSGLLLEISTCLKLFSGLQNLRDHVLHFFDTTPHQVRPGLAHTAGGAWLLTFARHEIRGDETRALFIDRLNALPVRVLHDYPDAVDALSKMGFTTLGDVARQIESSAVASFTRRLGREFAAAIADIYDIEKDFSRPALFGRPVTTHTPVEYFRERIRFDYPVTLVEQLQPAFENLLQQLSDFLRRRQLECQHIRWHLSDIYQNRQTADVRSDVPGSDWQLLYDLTLIAFDNRPIPFEVDCLELSCRDRLPRQAGNRTLDFSGRGRRQVDERELVVTMAKLKTRLGDSAVHKVSYRDSLRPELSHAVIGLAEKALQQLPEVHRRSLRPSWLLPEPETIEQRGRRLYWQGYLTLAAGPERLAGHWWEEPVARDYYLARRQDNVTVWVYRDLYGGEWYVHGVFS